MSGRMRLIIRIVCREAEVRKNELLSPRRCRHLVQARQVAMWLARQYTPHSLPAIGRMLGGKDHSTVLHAVRKLDAMLERHRTGLPLTEDELEMVHLLRICDRRLQEELRGTVLAAELESSWTDYLANCRRRHAERQAAWRQEAASHRRARRIQADMWRWRPRLSGSVVVVVPRGRTLTQQLQGDPPPGRSALDRLRQRQRISWEARIRRSLSISENRQEEMTW